MRDTANARHRAMIETDGAIEPGRAAREALASGAEEVVVVRTVGALEPATLATLRSLTRIRLRVTIATFDEAVHLRLGLAGTPKDLVRDIARASSIGIPVEVVLPIAEGLAPVAGRLHGLSRAAPKVARYLLTPIPDDLPARSPDDVAEEIAAARAVAEELSLTLSTDDDTRIDTELQAVLAGIKPVMRLSISRGEDTDERTLQARYARFGLVACAGTGLFVDDDGDHERRLRLVYVAKTMETAERVRAVEARTFARNVTEFRADDDRAPEYRDLGLALGYPRCCVDAYVQRMIVAPSAIQESPPSEAFLAASGAWQESPAWQLNHLLFESGAALITFTPCSYRCEAALDYASRVLAHIDRVAPLAAARLRKRLAVDIAIDRQGSRVLVELAGSRVIAAHPRRSPSGAYVHPLDLALAQQLVSGAAGDSSSKDAPIVVRFGSSAIAAREAHRG